MGVLLLLTSPPSTLRAVGGGSAAGPSHSRNYPMLQKSPWRSCRIKIRNNRIGANGFLNQRCALTPDLESILRARTGKIVLQHNRPQSGHRELVSTYSSSAKPK